MIPIQKHQALNNPHQLFIANVKAKKPQNMVIVDFQPIVKHNQVRESILPRFNQDGNYFTSAFVIDQQERITRQNLDYQRSKFDMLIQQSNEKPISENIDDYTPVPTYCQVCKVHFINYREHISLINHNENVRTSKGSFLVKEICQMFEHHKSNEKTDEEQAGNIVLPKKTKSSMFKKEKGIEKSSKKKSKSFCMRETIKSKIIFQQTRKFASI